MAKKNILDGYFSFHVESELDLLLSLMPAALIQEIKSPCSEFFDKEKTQSFHEIKTNIYRKTLDNIHEDHLIYNLVQAILTQQCTVNEASTMIMYYTFISHFIENLAKVLPLEQVAGQITVSDEGLVAVNKQAWKSLTFYNGATTTVLPFSNEPIEANVCRRFPLIGGPYGYPVARYAIENGGRCFSLPVFLPKALKDCFDFHTMRRAHGLDTNAADILLHDIAHAAFNENPNAAMPRIQFINTIAKLLGREKKPGLIRKKLLLLFKTLHDEPINLSYLYQFLKNHCLPHTVKLQIGLAIRDILTKYPEVFDDVTLSSVKQRLKTQITEIANMRLLFLAITSRPPVCTLSATSALYAVNHAQVESYNASHFLDHGILKF